MQNMSKIMPKIEQRGRRKVKNIGGDTPTLEFWIQYKGPFTNFVSTILQFKVQSTDLTCDVIKKVAPRTDVLNLQTE